MCIRDRPIAIETELQIGDEVIVHHNVFRRWHNIRGEEKNSRSYIDDNNYCVNESQVFSYKRDNEDWKTLSGYCFVKPIKSNDDLILFDILFLHVLSIAHLLANFT